MDEATPHLHLDYIPVAHGYKKGLKTRNSLTKALQEMGIVPANSKTDTETMHWQERERAYLTDLCRDRGIEIEVLGVQRDNYSIPEYKQAMREKEAAEAEMEILKSEKAEVTEAISVIDAKIESGKEEIEEQLDILDEINTKISEAEKRAEARTNTLNRILDAGKPVEKKIAAIRAKTTVTPAIFGGEPTVRVPRSVFEDMLAKYRAAGTFENLSKQYEKLLTSKQKKIELLHEEIRKWEEKYEKCTEFLAGYNLLNTFKEFIRAKTIKEQMTVEKKKLGRLGKSNKRIRIVTGKENSIEM